MNFRRISLKALVMATVMMAAFGGFIVLAGCGGGSSSTAPPPVSKGAVYPVVSGLSYRTNSTSGVVGADGSYTYRAHENVTFSAGGIDIASVPAGPKVTPLPIGNDAASTNMLRFFKGLDTNSNLNDGATLPTLPQVKSTPTMDWNNATSVASAQGMLLASSTFPSATSDILAALESAKTIRAQNLGIYGSRYQTIAGFPPSNTSFCASSLSAKSATVTLTSQLFGAGDTVSGTAAITLNDNSSVTFPLTKYEGSFKTSAGTTLYYSINPEWSGSRIIWMKLSSSNSNASLPSDSCLLALRDNSQPNKMPVPFISSSFVSTASPSVCSYGADFNVGNGLFGQYALGSYDTDGYIVSQTWTTSKGKTGTGT